VFSEDGLHDISVTALQKSTARSTTCQVIGEAFGSGETRRINCGPGVKRQYRQGQLAWKHAKTAVVV